MATLIGIRYRFAVVEGVGLSEDQAKSEAKVRFLDEDARSCLDMSGLRAISCNRQGDPIILGNLPRTVIPGDAVVVFVSGGDVVFGRKAEYDLALKGL